MKEPDFTRKIVHIDMDAYYASIEQRDFPELKGKAIAVGGGGARGVVATASYEARKYGVHSAMSGFQAQKLCPHIIFVAARFDVYKEVSQQIREVFYEFTDIVEPLSLDEAYLDVTNNKHQIPYAMEVAQQIMQAIADKTQLTCSAGVSYCKFLAKIASDYKKPNGLTVVRPHQALPFLERLPVKKFFGVGKVTANKMNTLGITTGADLKKYSKFELAKLFGKTGQFYYDIVRGVDNRPVRTSRVRKSLAIERTFEQDLSSFEDIIKVLEPIVDKFYERLCKVNNFGRTLTLKLKTDDFQIISRSLSKNYFIKDKEEIRKLAHDLLQENIEEFEKIRLIGLTASNLEKQDSGKGIGVQLKIDFDYRGNNEAE